MNGFYLMPLHARRVAFEPLFSTMIAVSSLPALSVCSQIIALCTRARYTWIRRTIEWRLAETRSHKHFRLDPVKIKRAQRGAARRH